jgi:hypothetical protein
MKTVNLKKNSKEELIIYIEKLSRDMNRIQEENLMLRKNNQSNIQYIRELEMYIDKLKEKN